MRKFIYVTHKWNLTVKKLIQIFISVCGYNITLNIYVGLMPNIRHALPLLLRWKSNELLWSLL